ncbi:MAG: hypothetical protein ABR585_12845 [Gemmatimonadaceae bacterium]|nr:hypothetical protein [Actinomycetota bacterium]
MPIDRVFRRLKKKVRKEETRSQLDVVLKSELQEAIEGLQAFSKEVKKEMDFIDMADKKHIIPKELIGDEGED